MSKDLQVTEVIEKQISQYRIITEPSADTLKGGWT